MVLIMDFKEDKTILISKSLQQPLGAWDVNNRGRLLGRIQETNIRVFQGKLVMNSQESLILQGTMERNFFGTWSINRERKVDVF